MIAISNKNDDLVMYPPNRVKPSLLGILLGAFICLSAAILSAQKIPVAVLDFEGFGISRSETQVLTSRLRNELFHVGEFLMLERGLMESILAEQGFQLAGCTTNECLVEVGRLIGARQMIGGSISKIGRTYTVSARRVDVETGQIVSVSDVDLQASLDEMLTEGMREVAIDLAQGGIISDPLETGVESTGRDESLLSRPVSLAASVRRPWFFSLGGFMNEESEVRYFHEGGITLSYFSDKAFKVGNLSLRPAFSFLLGGGDWSKAVAHYGDKNLMAALFELRSEFRRNNLEVNPFLGGGPGYVSSSVTQTDEEGNDDRSIKVGMSTVISAGVRFAVNPIPLAGEIRSSRDLVYKINLVSIGLGLRW